VGSDHLDVKIDTVVAALAALFGVITGKHPAFRVSRLTLFGEEPAT